MNRSDAIVLGALAAAGALWWLASPPGRAALAQARAYWAGLQLPDDDVAGPFDPRAPLDPDAPGTEPLPDPEPLPHDRG